MDIPLDVDVLCADRPGGRSTTIILNPVDNEVTHFVVKDRGEEYLIPLDEIVESGPNHIQLRITYEEMTRHQRFVKMQPARGIQQQGVASLLPGCQFGILTNFKRRHVSG